MAETKTSEAIEFYFDFTSPYAYFASLHVNEIGQRQGRPMLWKPICHHAGALPGVPLDAVNDDWDDVRALQAEYVLMDTARVARLHRIELNVVNPMASTELADRAYIWLFDQTPRVAHNFAEAVFHAHWRLGQNIEDIDLIGDCAAAADQDRAAVKACLDDPGLQARVIHHREMVRKAGVFSAPSLCVNGQLFWGWDRMAMAEAWLEHGGW